MTKDKVVEGITESANTFLDELRDLADKQEDESMKFLIEHTRHQIAELIEELEILLP